MLGIEGIEYDIIKDNFDEEFEEITDDPEVDIVFLTEHILVKHKDFILKYKMTKRKPIIIEIPGMLNIFHEDYVSDVIKKYIGINFSED